MKINTLFQLFTSNLVVRRQMLPTPTRASLAGSDVDLRLELMNMFKLELNATWPGN